MDVPTDGQLIRGPEAAPSGPWQRQHSLPKRTLYLGEPMTLPPYLGFELGRLALDLTHEKLLEDFPAGNFPPELADTVFREELSRLLIACQHEDD